MSKIGNSKYPFRVSARIYALLITIYIAGLFSPVTNSQTVGSVLPFGGGITAKQFFSSMVGKDNTVWFLTETGVVSFDGSKWVLHNANPKITSAGLKDIESGSSATGQELWIASHTGVMVASVPLDAKSGVTTYNSENSKILSNNVLALAAGKDELMWFGTDKGIFALRNGKWLTNSYDDRYPEAIFQFFPITAMATSINGDSLYIGSHGSGVMRVYRNDVDAVSGASEYLGWGPILIPSDTVYSVHISADGTQWIGTKRGVAKHTGYKTLEGWTVYNTAEGLADNIVQAINSDSRGNLYFGTKNGLSVFDGMKWTTYNEVNGLAGNNILTIVVDKKDCVWLGTDNGVSCLKGGKIISYR